MSATGVDRGGRMARCEVCGNVTARGIQVTANGTTHVFDTYQCVIHRMTAECEHCGCRILGRAVEVQERAYCSPECLAAVQSPPARVYPLHLRNP